MGPLATKVKKVAKTSKDKALTKAKAPKIPARSKGVLLAQDAAVIEVDSIGPDPDQPRKVFDEAMLDLLGESLEIRGQLQPILVRWVEERSSYVIVDGERRWRAAVRKGIKRLLCWIDSRVRGPEEIYLDQLVANCHRSDLTPIEQAESIRHVMETMKWGQRRVADELGISQPAVSKALALLDLPAILAKHLKKETLTPSVVRELVKIKDPERLSVFVAEAAVNGWSQAETAEKVKALAAKDVDLIDKIVFQEPPVEKGVEPLWNEWFLGMDADLTDYQVEQAKIEGILTFGQLDARFRRGVKKETFKEAGIALWAALQKVKGYVPEAPMPIIEVPKPVEPRASKKPEVELTSKLYHYEASNGIDFVIKRTKDWSSNEILEAVWELKNKLETEYIDMVV
jgi:ParB/RepB/Spo0J family partition protein